MKKKIQITDFLPCKIFFKQFNDLIKLPLNYNLLQHLSQYGNSPCFYIFKMFAVRIIFLIFLFGNGFCQDNGALEALEKRVAKLEALLGNGFKGPFGKFSLSSSFDTIFYINRWFPSFFFQIFKAPQKETKLISRLLVKVLVKTLELCWLTLEEIQIYASSEYI